MGSPNPSLGVLRGCWEPKPINQGSWGGYGIPSPITQEVLSAVRVLGGCGEPKPHAKGS